MPFARKISSFDVDEHVMNDQGSTAALNNTTPVRPPLDLRDVAWIMRGGVRACASPASANPSTGEAWPALCSPSSANEKTEEPDTRARSSYRDAAATKSDWTWTLADTTRDTRLCAPLEPNHRQTPRANLRCAVSQMKTTVVDDDVDADVMCSVTRTSHNARQRARAGRDLFARAVARRGGVRAVRAARRERAWRAATAAPECVSKVGRGLTRAERRACAREGARAIAAAVA